MKKIEIFIPPGLIFALLGFQFIYAYDYFDLFIWGMEFISLLMIIGLCVLAYKLQSKLMLAIILFVKSATTMFLLFFWLLCIGILAGGMVDLVGTVILGIMIILGLCTIVVSIIVFISELKLLIKKV